MYDSTEDTKKHIEKVGQLLGLFIVELAKRGVTHDASKLKTPEKEVFDVYTPLLKDCDYNSEAYKHHLSEMGTALTHHYKYNHHHPEHRGIDNMTLIDIIEMFCDWKAATMRHTTGDFTKSLEINRTRFKISDQLQHIFENTNKELDW